MKKAPPGAPRLCVESVPAATPTAEKTELAPQSRATALTSIRLVAPQKARY
jgi:hypothetical protein